jgi:hypothetical protein
MVRSVRALVALGASVIAGAPLPAWAAGIDFDGADAPTAARNFRFDGSHWRGGRVATEAAPGLFASGAFHYAVPDSGASVQFAPPVRDLSFFFVHGFGYAPGTATAYDASGQVLATAQSRRAGVFADAGNYVRPASASPVARVEFTGGVVDDVSWQGQATGTFPIDTGVNGAWVNTSHDPALDGHGLLFEVYPEADVLFVAWFTFDPGAPSTGDDGQRWLTAQGTVDGGTAMLDIIDTTGGRFDRPDPVTREVIGSLRVELTACDRGTVHYDMPERGLQGTFEITRQRSVLFGSTCD